MNIKICETGFNLGSPLNLTNITKKSNLETRIRNEIAHNL